MSGSAAEPSAQHAAEQMRVATERLRDKAWMVTAITTPEPASPGDHAENAPTAEV